MMVLQTQIDDLMDKWDKAANDKERLQSGLKQIIENLTYEIDFGHTQQQRDGMAMLTRHLAYRLLDAKNGEAYSEPEPYPTDTPEDDELGTWDQ